jgi:hypothetical protein
MHSKQVNKAHYSFSNYFNKRRWQSLWHQVDEILSVSPKNLLEVGPGVGILKNILKTFGLHVETLDLDSELKPDHIASVLKLPFNDGSYDCVCAFQMLEHLPYDQSLIAFGEMVRVSNKHILISLPDASVLWPISISFPKIGTFCIYIPNPISFFNREHVFDGQHYWELNKKKYAISRIKSDFLKFNVTLKRSYRVKENPYHRFFVYVKNSK